MKVGRLGGFVMVWRVTGKVVMVKVVMEEIVLVTRVRQRPRPMEVNTASRPTIWYSIKSL